MEQRRIEQQMARTVKHDAMTQVRDYGRRARLRAIKEPRDCRVLADGALSVSSLSRPGVRHRVEFHGAVDQVVWFTCTCPSGTYRTHQPVTCVHAAIAGLILEQYGTARWGRESGLWYRNH